jgi:nucleoside-diphosphate-sugar epimerase
VKAFITGATGFIGSRLALHCLEAGHSVRVLGQARNEQEEENAGALERKGAEVVIASVTDRDRLLQALDEIEVVFHLAAAQHEANVPDQHFWDVNVEGTRNMLDASVAAGARRFVHGSSIGVYGGVGRGTVRDDSPLEPDNIYGVTKLAGEEVVRSYAERIDFVISRISETYGPGDRRLVKLFKGVQKGNFPMIGAGDNLHPLIYIDDLIEGLLLAAASERAVGKTIVMAGSQPVSTREMVTIVARQLGKSPPRLRIPLAPMMLVANTMQAVLRPLGIQPPLHPRRMNFYRKSFAFSMDEARTVLGFEPKTDFRTGAAQTARWYEAQGIL